MKRRSVFADKLSEFPFVFGDESVTSQRGRWHHHFQTRRVNSPLSVRASSTCVDPSSLISSPSSLVLEIGCYTGDFLARIAAKCLHTNFVGLDWKARPLYLGAQQIVPMNLANLSLLRARAQDLPTMFADGELDEIWLLHPEPCDRENERANRLMSERFLIDAHRLLRADGRLILKTDHLDYFRCTRELLRLPEIASRFSIEFGSSDYWSDADVQKATASSCLAGELTFYEARFVRKRQAICFLQIKRV